MNLDYDKAAMRGTIRIIIFVALTALTDLLKSQKGKEYVCH